MSFNLDNAPAMLRAAGLTVIETEGWFNRGYLGQDLQACAGVLWHHTATGAARNYTSGLPTKNVLIAGHAGLPGPLCNIGLGRAGEVYMIATGVANHAGTGRAHGVPVNMGNHYLIGIEMESSGVKPWDWTPAQLAAAPVLGAALERAYMMHLDPSARLQLGHLEYSDAGKIDPAGWPGGMDGLRAQINAQLSAWGGGSAPAPAPSAPAPAPAPAPSGGPTGWTVDPGDNMSKIAAAVGVSLAALIAANPGIDPNRIYPGQALRLPAGARWPN